VSVLPGKVSVPVSNERYEPCLLGSGEMIGTPEEGFDVGAVYLAE